MIYVDMDGVLCDLVGQVEEYLASDGIYNESNYGTYKIQEATSHIDLPMLYSCFSDVDFWSNMRELPWAHYLLKKVEEIDDVYILSRPWLEHNDGASEACLCGKIEWITAYYPRFLGRLLFVDKKEDFAHPKAVLIDDNFENCQKFADAGGKTIFLPTPWGDKDYGRREASGFDLVRKVLECELKIVESM